MAMRPELPTGTLTFFFSDVEGSTKMVQRLGPRWKDVLETHERLVREAFHGTGAVEVRTIGDAFFVVFPSADAAVAGAVAAQRIHATYDWPSDAVVRMRIGMHTGVAELGGDDYVGIDVHLAARIAGAAHGGQIVVSDQTKALVRAPGDGISTRDLGDHRLKDVGSLRLWQIVAPGLAEDFPPLNSLEIPSNLPADPTTFIGREREASEVRDLVRSQRLVTLTGPGGTGKTRLSLQVAREITPEFPHGTFFIPLEPIREAALVAPAIAEAIGLREDPSRPVADAVSEKLRDRTTLLVLDNFEQVAAGAPLIADLLRAAPRLRCLASSREALRVYGEQEYPVPTLSDDDAVTLFLERARMVKPDLAATDDARAAIAAICRRLDHLPLAIELAAARVKVFSLDALGARLERSLSVLTGGARDRSERQRTLRGAIAWSYDLLSEDERATFRRLAVFAGGCRVEAAEAVCDAGRPSEMAAIDALPSLVDKSLLRSSSETDGETRFTMLQTIREFGLERLAEAGETADARRRHAEWTLAFVESAKAGLTTGDDAPVLERLAAEHDNIREAVAWAIEAGEAGIGLRIGEAVWRFWQQRGHLAEGRSLVERLLALPQAADRTVERARGLTALAGLAYWQGDFAPLEGAYGEAVAIYRDAGDKPALAEALYNESFVPFLRGDVDRALSILEQSRSLYEEIGDRVGLAEADQVMAAMQYRRGNVAGALAAEESVIRFRREQRNAFRLADSLTFYAVLLFDSGHVAEGRGAVEEGLRLAEGTGNVTGTISLLLVCARLAVQRGKPANAARISGTIDRLREQTSGGATVVEVLGVAPPADEARKALGDEAYARESSAGRKLSAVDAAARAFL